MPDKGGCAVGRKSETKGGCKEGKKKVGKVVKKSTIVIPKKKIEMATAAKPKPVAKPKAKPKKKMMVKVTSKTDPMNKTMSAINAKKVPTIPYPTSESIVDRINEIIKRENPNMRIGSNAADKRGNEIYKIIYNKKKMRAGVSYRTASYKKLIANKQEKIVSNLDGFMKHAEMLGDKLKESQDIKKSKKADKKKSQNPELEKMIKDKYKVGEKVEIGGGLRDTDDFTRGFYLAPGKTFTITNITKTSVMLISEKDSDGEFTTKRMSLFKFAGNENLIEN